MKRKVYAINGYVEFSSVFQIGTAPVRVDFKGGQISSTTGMNPATYTTSNPALQDAIEKSEKFQSGFIVIKSEKEIILATKSGAKAPNSQSKKERKDEDQGTASTICEDVKNTQEAKAFLIEKFNVDLSELQTKSGVKAKAAELKVSFPNWN